MKIIGVLSWYSESPAWLSACVASMARVCDHVLAVDGRYALYDADSAVSPPEQAEAIVETATGAGIALTLHRPSEPFYGNEVEKRNLTLRLAAVHAIPMKDWLLVMDADCYILEASDNLHHDLERATQHSANISVEEAMDANSDAFQVKVAQDVSLPEAWRTGVTLMHRVIPNQAYHGTHYTLGGSVNGERVWQWGHPAAKEPFDATHLLAIKHRNTERPRRRQEQASAYYQARDRLRIETRPG